MTEKNILPKDNICTLCTYLKFIALLFCATIIGSFAPSLVLAGSSNTCSGTCVAPSLCNLGNGAGGPTTGTCPSGQLCCNLGGSSTSTDISSSPTPASGNLTPTPINPTPTTPTSSGKVDLCSGLTQYLSQQGSHCGVLSNGKNGTGQFCGGGNCGVGSSTISGDSNTRYTCSCQGGTCKTIKTENCSPCIVATNAYQPDLCAPGSTQSNITVGLGNSCAADGAQCMPSAACKGNIIQPKAGSWSDCPSTAVCCEPIVNTTAIPPAPPTPTSNPTTTGSGGSLVPSCNSYDIGGQATCLCATDIQVNGAPSCLPESTGNYDCSGICGGSCDVTYSDNNGVSHSCRTPIVTDNACTALNNKLGYKPGPGAGFSCISSGNCNSAGGDVITIAGNGGCTGGNVCCELNTCTTSGTQYTCEPKATCLNKSAYANSIYDSGPKGCASSQVCCNCPDCGLVSPAP